MGLLAGPTTVPLQMTNRSRVLTFRLGATGQLPDLPDVSPPEMPEVPEQKANAETIDQGRRLYTERCLVCHGYSVVSGGLTPDLRYSNAQIYAEWDAIVIGGSRSANGMPPFAGVLTPEQSQAVKAYIIDRAHALR
jgi:mono/diheme cytochrome c family protein